jgi:RNA polymerase sigma factor (sigma-70 family)
MKQSLVLKGELERTRVHEWLSPKIQRLGRRLARFRPDAVHLRVVLRVPETGARAQTSLTLHLPSRALAASEEAADPKAAIHAAFAELERLVDREKARLRGDGKRARSVERFRKELLDQATSLARDREGVATQLDSLTPHLRDVEAFVDRELRWLEASREILPGEIDARDVVDATFAAALEQRHRHLADRKLLLRLATGIVRQEAARARRAHESEVHLEENARKASIPKRPDGARTDPDRDPWGSSLVVEDLVPGLDGNPEEFKASAETAAVLQDALAVLPTRWRQAFLLARVEELSEPEMEEALQLSSEEIRTMVALAQAFLRARLEEAEHTLEGARERSVGS